MSNPVLNLIVLLEDNLASVATDCFDDHIFDGTDVSAGQVTAVGASCQVANQCRALRSRSYKAGSRSYCEAMYQDCLLVSRATSALCPYKFCAVPAAWFITPSTVDFVSP